MKNVQRLFKSSAAIIWYVYKIVLRFNVQVIQADNGLHCHNTIGMAQTEQKELQTE